MTYLRAVSEIIKFSQIASTENKAKDKVWESGCGAMFTPKGPYPNDEREDRPWLLWLAKFFFLANRPRTHPVACRNLF